MITRLTSRFAFVLVCITSLSAASCERPMENRPPEELLNCNSDCMPLTIRGQYRNISEPGAGVQGQKVEVLWGSCWFCNPEFSLITDAEGRFEVETLVDTARLSGRPYLEINAWVDTSLYLSAPGHHAGYGKFILSDYQREPDAFMDLEIELYRKAYLFVELDSTGNQLLEHVFVSQQYKADYTRFGLVVGRTNVSVAQVPVAIFVDRRYADGRRVTSTDTLTLTPDEVRTYRIAY